MEFKGTKGKWITEVNDHDPFYKRPVIEVGLKGHYPVSVVYGDGKDFNQEAQANALLISKAPEMLEMLRSVLATEHLKGTIEESKIKQLIKEATEL